MKPENLLYTSKDENATLKLTDFGFAKEEISNLKSPCFTAYYVSPEIVKGEEYTAKCDIWALGVIMYMLFFRTPPFYSLTDEPLSNGLLIYLFNLLVNLYIAYSDSIY